MFSPTGYGKLIWVFGESYMSHHSEHSYARLLYHFVWATADRKPFITAEVEGKLYASIGQICKQRDWHLRAIGGTENHIHLIVQLSVKQELPDVVARIKSNSCRFIRKEGWPDFAWQQGYGVFTTDSLVRLQSYIDGQKAHHQQQDYADECRALAADKLVF